MTLQPSTNPPDTMSSVPVTLSDRLSESWMPYVAPFVLFVLLSSIENFRPVWYPAMYGGKLLLVSASIAWLWRRRLRRAPPAPGALALAVLAGVTLGLTWIPIDRLQGNFARLGARVAYDPFAALHSPGDRSIFLLLRFFGLVVVAPTVEELFYRGFLLRFATNLDDWRSVPLGMFSPASMAVNVLLFASGHPEWMVAALFSAAMCFLIRRTRDLRVPLLAHATANLVMGLVIVHTSQWKYW